MEKDCYLVGEKIREKQKEDEKKKRWSLQKISLTKLE